VRSEISRPVLVAVFLVAVAAVTSTSAIPLDPIRIRVQNFPGDRWHEGDFVRMTRHDLVVSWSHERAPDTLALRTLHSIQVSDHARTSGWRLLAALGTGLAAGGIVGSAVGLAVTPQYHHSDFYIPPVFTGAFIGAIVGGFAGLVVGLAPLPVWERVDPAAIESLSTSMGPETIPVDTVEAAGFGLAAVGLLRPNTGWTGPPGRPIDAGVVTIVDRSLRTGVPLRVPSMVCFGSPTRGGSAAIPMAGGASWIDPGVR